MSDQANGVGFCHDDARHESTGERYRAAVHGPDGMSRAVVAALRKVYDPEIPVNIFDLGLIYRIAINDEGDVAIDMTLTSPTCPVAGMMPLMVKNAVGDVDGAGLIDVTMVWDPPWSQDHMTDEAQLQLGLI